MSTPITWQNIAAPQLSDYSRSLGAAQQTISGAFEGLRGAFGDYKKGEEEIWKKEDAAATQNLLDKIYRARDVDAFNQLNASGALDQVTAANGARIDRAQINALRDARPGVLQDRAVKDLTYQHTMLDESQAPLMRKIQMLSRIDPQGAQRLLDQNPDLRSGFELAKEIDTQGWNREQRDYTRAEEAQKVLKRPLDLEALKASTDSSVAAAASSRSAVRLNNLNFDITQQDRDRKLLENKTAVEMADNPYRNGPLTAGNLALIVKEAKDLGVGLDGLGYSQGEKLQEVMQKLSTLANAGQKVTVVDKDGTPREVNVPIPFDVARAAVLGAQNEGFFKWNSGYATAVDNNITEALKGLKLMPSVKGADGVVRPASSPLVRHYQDYLDMGQYSLNPARTGTTGTNNAGSTSSGGGGGGKRK